MGDDADMDEVLQHLQGITRLPDGEDRAAALQRLLSSAALARLARPGSPLWPSLLALEAAVDQGSR